MAKILWYGDILSNTGFARVTHSILEHLSKQHDIVAYGINYNGDPHDLRFSVYPANAGNPTDRFGIGRLPKIVEKEKPDFIICCNDIWIVNQVWERIHLLKDAIKFKFIAYFPVDSEYYVSSHLRFIKDWDFAITFTVEQANRLLSQGVKPKKFGVIPHGLDTTIFYPMDKAVARKVLRLPEDKFIVLNANRNQPRKNIDLTIKAFAKFAEGREDTLLYLHMSEKDLGWDIRAIFDAEMKRRDIDPTGRMIMTSANINYADAPPDKLLNQIYNACDVGINTANGEGWGLVPFEHACCKRPQVLPDHTSSQDIWKNSALLIDVAAWIYDKDLGLERGIIDVDDAAEKLGKLHDDKEFYEKTAEDCFNVTRNPAYRWDGIAEGFNSAIEEINK